jgi:hypothetical protein
MVSNPWSQRAFHARLGKTRGALAAGFPTVAESAGIEPARIRFSLCLGQESGREIGQFQFEGSFLEL